MLKITRLETFVIGDGPEIDPDKGGVEPLDDRNAWRDAWTKLDTSGSAVPLTVVRGDQLDQNAMSVEEAYVGDVSALTRLNELLDMSFDKIVIASVWIASRPRVPVSERVVLTTLDERLIRVDLRYGYMQVVNVP